MEFPAMLSPPATPPLNMKTTNANNVADNLAATATTTSDNSNSSNSSNMTNDYNKVCTTAGPKLECSNRFVSVSIALFMEVDVRVCVYL